MNQYIMNDLLPTPKQKGNLYLASSLCDGLEDLNIRQVATLLKNKEADPNVLMPLHGITPFHLVIGNDSEIFAEEVIKLFLRHGGNPNVRSVDGMTPVHVAAAWGRTNILEMLLVNGGDPLYEDNDCCTPFNYAFQGEHYEAISLLSKFCIKNKDDEKPKFKRKLDKVIINNGDVLAEYILSKDSEADNSLGLKLEKKKKKVFTNQEFNKKDSYDFSRENEEEEINLINEIISKLSSSIASDADESIQNHKSNPQYQTTSPKRMQIKMKFNRLENSAKSEKETQNSNLQVIKKYTKIPCLKNNNILSKLNKQEKNLVPRKIHSLNIGLNNTENKVHEPITSSSQKNYSKIIWKDEIILSKSPNLIINSSSPERKNIHHKSLSTNFKEISKTSFESSYNTHSNSSLLSKIPLLKKSTSGSLEKLKKLSQMSKNAMLLDKKMHTSCLISSLTPLKNGQHSSEKASKRQSLENIALNINNSSDCSEIFKNKSTMEKFINNSNLISGIEYLNLDSSSNSNSMSNSPLNKCQKKNIIFQELSTNLNKAIFNSCSIVETQEENTYDCDIDGSKKSHESDNSSGCLICAENILSEVNSSFLSLSQNNTTYYYDNIKNDFEYETIHHVPAESNPCECPNSNRLFRLEEEYKYNDPEEGIIFVERRFCVSPSRGSSEINTSYYSCSSSKSEILPKELYFMDNLTLRKKLKNFGENPGPITDTTYHVYLKRLHKLQSKIKINDSNSRSNLYFNLDIERKLLKSSILSTDWLKNLDTFTSLEHKIFKEFTSPDPSRKWREGTSKSSFNYLLLDPRITKDLPRRAADLSLDEKWQIFLSSIFYVGKGKKSRPYAHLYDAFKIWVLKDNQNFNSDKVQRILDIWNEDKGVIVLHVFHNTIPVEAYTREAAMIEALGTRKLGNCKNGDYYGIVSTWKSKEKCELGRYFLYKAMQILLVEGERQIFPDNL